MSIFINLVLAACFVAACIRIYQQEKYKASITAQNAELNQEKQSLSEQLSSSLQEKQDLSSQLTKLQGKTEELQTSLQRLKKENRRLRERGHTSRPAPQPATAPIEFTKQIDRPNVREATEEAPKEAPKLVTFGAWPPNVHHANGQKIRYERAKTQNFTLVSMENHRAVLRSESGNLYHVTLNSCDCPDFAEHLDKQRPCKHIYYLALQLGFPLSDIFGE